MEYNIIVYFILLMSKYVGTYIIIRAFIYRQLYFLELEKKINKGAIIVNLFLQIFQTFIYSEENIVGIGK